MPAHRSARLPQRESSNAPAATDSPDPEDLLTVDEVCAKLRVTRSTFNDWRAKQCAPPCVRLPNRQLRFRASALERWLASHEEASA
ncbi:helix-turn-helix transcriptional regulator [Amycolatopsis australiensis]|uniref:Predicted DNA-binding transcriptional regulator AlpA n=1 Tax=Amycolatopsis australiensis TaxID=546364 RepID=A0A1K1SVJ8_9PSEU|nr:Predicted DNA-binding transcriptional regulator AlpA [Amycolatopsis australiensis]